MDGLEKSISFALHTPYYLLLATYYLLLSTIMLSYLFVSLALFLVWLALILCSHKTRREQLIMSVVGLVVAPGLLILASNDYRNIVSDNLASIGIEDLLFSFSLFGISAVIYQVLLGKHTHKLKGKRFYASHPAIHWYVHLILVLGLWAVVSLLMIDIFALSSIRALVVGGLLIGIYTIADRRDLLLDALLSGLFMALLIFITEQIFFVRLFPEAAEGFWRLSEINTLFIGGVPLEELLWAAVVGFAIGPMYEWLRRYELK